MLNNEFLQITAFCKGGGGTPKPPKPPAPPSPTTAAENVAKFALLDRQRRARGYASTYLTGATIGAPDSQPQSLMQKLFPQ